MLSYLLESAVNSDQQIIRKKTRKIFIGDVPVGGDAPISIQSMTNTLTSDVKSTVLQINQLADAGADIVRVSVPDQEAADAFKLIKQESTIPLVADIHFDYMMALEAIKGGADCIRINPGNIGKEAKVKEVISAAKDTNTPIRVGVNAGSLERKLQIKYGEPNSDALVESALTHINILKRLNFEDFKLSIKASDVQLAVESYRKISKLIDQPLHLGITEAGGFRSGTVKSAVGLGSLLMEGIGDTIRVSLSSDPVDEVKAGYEILKSLGIRSRGVNIISCPSCARQAFPVIETVKLLEKKLAHIRKPINLSIIGCVVNGPGEAAQTEIGLTGGGQDNNLLYLSGVPHSKVPSSEIIDRVVKLVEEKTKEI